MNKWTIDPSAIEQLSLGLELPEADLSETGWVTPAEARRRSTVARAALLRDQSLGQPVTGLNHPGWFDTYESLLTANWPWRVACYIAWAASPKIGRWPATQQLLATEVLGLTSDRQIATWRKRNPSIDEVIGIMQAAPLMEHRADVMLALSISASDPDHRNNPDRKLYLEMLGDHTPHSEIDVRALNTRDLKDLSDEELDQLSRELLKKEKGDEGHQSA